MTYGKFRDLPRKSDHQPHNAIPLTARGRHWVECTCGYVTQSYATSQASALYEHAMHVRDAKQPSKTGDQSDIEINPA